MTSPTPRPPLTAGQIATPRIACHCCGFEVMDGEALRCRVVRFTRCYGQAKCPRCKTWVRVPVVLQAPPRAAG